MTEKFTTEDLLKIVNDCAPLALQERFRIFIPEILEGLTVSEDVKKYGFKDVEDIVTTLSNERQKIIRFEQKNKTLKEFLIKRIAELDHRIQSWTNFTQAGNTQYQIVSLRLETYKEILSEITGDSI